MPRIPLSTAQKIGHVDAEVNQQTAPGMGFGMDDARALQNAGDAIGQAGRGLGSALMQFGERVQEAEDRLAAAEYETAWNKRQKELEKRMKENPGSVKDFGKWATESDAAWENDSKQYTDRMSKRYRDVFETNWRRHRDNAVYRRQELTIQAQVKSLQEGYTKQIQERINAGDYGGARDLVTGISNMKDADGKSCSPFTEDQIKGFGEFVDKSETFGELREIFDSGNAKDIENTLELLKVRNKDGGYLHDLGLTEEERVRWIKYGENVQMQQRNDAAKAYLAEVNSTGKYQTKEELNELLKAGEITEEDYNFRWKIAEGKEREAEREKDKAYLAKVNSTGEYQTKAELDKLLESGEITAEDYNFRLKIAEGKEQEAEREKDKAFRDEMSEVIADYNRGGSIVDVRDELELKLERGIITPAQYNEGIRIIEILESKEEEQKIAVLKAAVEELEARIQTADYPAPAEQLQWQTQYYNEIKKAFAEYPKIQEKLMKAVDQRLKDDPLEKTEIGRELKKTVDGYIRQADQSIGLGNLDDYFKFSDTEMVDLKLQFYQAARQFSTEPGATYSSCAKKLEEVKKAVFEQRIKNIFNPYTGSVHDFNKYGKVFRESEIPLDEEERTYRVMRPDGVRGRAIPLSPTQIAAIRAKKATELEEQGYIDKDDIQVFEIIDEKTGKTRTVWRSVKDGREVYADEYE